MLPALTFVKRAERLVHYQGAMRDISLTQAVAPTAAAAEARSGELPSSPDEVRAMREAARRKRYPAASYGDIRHVSLDEALKEVN